MCLIMRFTRIILNHIVFALNDNPINKIQILHSIVSYQVDKDREAKLFYLEDKGMSHRHEISHMTMNLCRVSCLLIGWLDAR